MIKVPSLKSMRMVWKVAVGVYSLGHGTDLRSDDVHAVRYSMPVVE